MHLRTAEQVQRGRARHRLADTAGGGEFSPITGGCPHPKRQPQVPPEPTQRAVTGAGHENQVTASFLKASHPEERATSQTACPTRVGLKRLDSNPSKHTVCQHRAHASDDEPGPRVSADTPDTNTVTVTVSWQRHSWDTPATCGNPNLGGLGRSQHRASAPVTAEPVQRAPQQAEAAFPFTQRPPRWAGITGPKAILGAGIRGSRVRRPQDEGGQEVPKANLRNGLQKKGKNPQSQPSRERPP